MISRFILSSIFVASSLLLGGPLQSAASKVASASRPSASTATSASTIVEFPDPEKIQGLVDEISQIPKLISGRANSGEVVELVGTIISSICAHKKIDTFSQLSVSSAKIRAQFFKLASMIAKSPDRQKLKTVFWSCSNKACTIFSWPDDTIKTLSREMTDIEVHQTFVNPTTKLLTYLIGAAAASVTLYKVATDVVPFVKKKIKPDPPPTQAPAQKPAFTPGPYVFYEDKDGKVFVGMLNKETIIETHNTNSASLRKQSTNPSSGNANPSLIPGSLTSTSGTPP